MFSLVIRASECKDYPVNINPSLFLLLRKSNFRKLIQLKNKNHETKVFQTSSFLIQYS